MERLSTCDLREKEVVNVCDGARIGCPSDFEFSVCDGRITAIIVQRGGGFWGLGKNGEIIIPWCKIECIGKDSILVRVSPEEYCGRESDKKKNAFWKL